MVVDGLVGPTALEPSEFLRVGVGWDQLTLPSARDQAEDGKTQRERPLETHQTWNTASKREKGAISQLQEQAALLSETKSEMDLMSTAMKSLLDGILEKDRAVEARSKDLSDRLVEVLRRETAALAAEEDLRKKALELSHREQNLAQEQLLVAASARELEEKRSSMSSQAEHLLKLEEQAAKSIERGRALADEAQSVLKDKEIVSKQREILKEYENALNEREFKLRESWDACASSALFSPAMSGLRQDAKLAELASLSPSAPCASCVKYETQLQRWAVCLALEAAALKARSDRLGREKAQFDDEIAGAKSNRRATEALMQEIKSREVELECAFNEMEARQASLEARSEQADARERDLKVEIQNADARSAELTLREKAVKSLEGLWNDRSQDLLAREETASKMQRRMARQREALELREADLIEGEERARIELVELAAKRNKLRDLEALLDRKLKAVSEREFDADVLLQSAQKERELIREFETDMEQKFGRLVKLAMDLEARGTRGETETGDS